MSTTADKDPHDYDKPVSQRNCDLRHRGLTRWLSVQVVVVLAVLGSAGGAFMSARNAVQDGAVQKARQQAVNERVLHSLKRIEIDIRAMRNGE